MAKFSEADAAFLGTVFDAFQFQAGDVAGLKGSLGEDGHSIRAVVVGHILSRDEPGDTFNRVYVCRLVGRPTYAGRSEVGRNFQHFMECELEPLKTPKDG